MTKRAKLAAAGASSCRGESCYRGDKSCLMMSDQVLSSRMQLARLPGEPTKRSRFLLPRPDEVHRLALPSIRTVSISACIHETLQGSNCFFLTETTTAAPRARSP